MFGVVGRADGHVLIRFDACDGDGGNNAPRERLEPRRRGLRGRAFRRVGIVVEPVIGIVPAVGTLQPNGDAGRTFQRIGDFECGRHRPAVPGVQCADFDAANPVRTIRPHVDIKGIVFGVVGCADGDVLIRLDACDGNSRDDPRRKRFESRRHSDPATCPCIHIVVKPVIGVVAADRAFQTDGDALCPPHSHRDDERYLEVAPAACINLPRVIASDAQCAIRPHQNLKRLVGREVVTLHGHALVTLHAQNRNRGNDASPRRSGTGGCSRKRSQQDYNQRCTPINFCTGE